MGEVILIMMFVCGQADTVIIKKPNETAVYTHELRNPIVVLDITEILKGNPIIIEYHEDRGRCA